ncbi:hypothetical protein ACFLY2_02070 [Patescibacteria group bacterium]
MSQDLFWKSDKNTLREEMLELFPEINKKVDRLNELKEIEKGQTHRSAPTDNVGVNLCVHPEIEIQDLNKELVEID